MNWRKLLDHKPFKYSLAGFGTSLILALTYFVGKPVMVEFNDSFAMKEFKEYGIIGTYRMHYHRVFDRLEKLSTADVREQNLLRELASTQKDLEVERVKNSEHEAKKETHEIAERLKTETGSPVAKVAEGIEYEVPTNILPHQLQVLGLEYFRKKDYEKSAVIFHELVHSKEDDGFKNPDNYLVSAISWYQLKHYEMASDYLKKAQKSAKPGSSIYRQALVWQAILEKTRGNRKVSQVIVTKLMSYYPQSEEAAWVNHSRAPASVKKKEQHVPKEHHHE